MKDSVKINSAIYEGKVIHSRYKPVTNSFTYDAFMLYLDIDEIQKVFSLSRLWSINAFNFVSFYRKDYLGDEVTDIKTSIHQRIEDETGTKLEGKVFLLTNLRYIGYITNPISCYYCFDNNEDLRYIVSEVTNTPWGERQSYVIPCDNKKTISRHVFAKQMYVSPFMPMNIQYHWQHTVPDEMLHLSIRCKQDGEQMLSAHIALKKLSLNSVSMRRIAISRSFMTLKISIATHWQAIKLFVKGVPPVAKPIKHSKYSSGKSIDEIQHF